MDGSEGTPARWPPSFRRQSPDADAGRPTDLGEPLTDGCWEEGKELRSKCWAKSFPFLPVFSSPSQLNLKSFKLKVICIGIFLVLSHRDAKGISHVGMQQFLEPGKYMGLARNALLCSKKKKFHWTGQSSSLQTEE